MDNKTSNIAARPYALKTILAAAGAVVVLACQATPSEARSHRHHAHRHHHHHHHRHANNEGWRNAQAAVGTQAAIGASEVRSVAAGRTFAGVASYYGNESGSRTASGQRMNPSAMTAAHRTLPFGTRVRVTHGSRSVVVTINDRGPFIRGRVLDLSTGAARAIGLNGIGHVTAEIIS